jgi:hypothetical protein
MSTQSKRMLLVALNIAGVIGTIIVNVLAVTLPLNNISTAQLSDRYPNLFVPAGYTFSIWSVIYLLLIAFIVYQVVVLVKEGARTETVIEKTGILFFITCCANVAWLFAWHYELIPLSVAVMFSLLLTLIVLYTRLDVGKAVVSAGERYCVHAAISVYLGWISVAAIANLSVLFVSLGLTLYGLPEQLWTAGAIIVGTALGLVALIRRGDIYYAAVLVWAFLGILIKRLTYNPSGPLSVIITVCAGLAALVLTALVRTIRGKI